MCFFALLTLSLFLAKKAEAAFAKQCRLISIRHQTILETKNSFIQIMDNQKNCQDSVLKLQQQNECSLEIMSLALCKLFGNQLRYQEIKDAIKVSMIESDIAIETSRFTKRSREILREIDCVKNDDGKLVASSLLHDMPQLFQKEVLVKNLESEMKQLLLINLKNEESTHPLYNYVSADDEDNDSVDTLDSGLSMMNDELDQKDETKDIQSDSGHVLEENFLNASLCKICDTNPCQWFDSNDGHHLLKERQDEMSTRLMLLKRQRVRLLSKKYEVEMQALEDIDEEIRVLTRTLTKTEQKLKLLAVSHELHNIMLSSSSKYVLVQSLHGYDTVMYKDEAIYALTVEEDRLVATLTARELLDDLLDRLVGLNI